MNNSIYVFEGNGAPTVTAVMATSGTFVMGHGVRELEQRPAIYPPPMNSHVSSSPEVANPMLIQPIQYEIQAVAPEQLIYELKDAFKEARIVTPAQLDGYADQLVNIARNLAARPIDLMIVPYRGGLTPSLHLQVMNIFKYPQLPLGFSAGSQERNRQGIEDELVSKLEGFRGREHLTIGVIDAAIRGDSALKLAEIMKSAKRHFDGVPWRVVFHLLHCEEKYPTPPLAKGIGDLSTADVSFQVELHNVPNLLVEDWDEGIGLRAEWQNGVCYYKNTTAGQVISKLPDGSVVVLESNNLPLLIHSFIAN